MVGERWSLLILRDVLLGISRFDDLQKSLGITRSVLSTRLEHLVEEGVVARHRYQRRPDRYEYVSTPKGLELWPVLMHLLDWGDRHYPQADGPPRVIAHVDCGGRMNSDLCCDRCGERLAPANTENGSPKSPSRR
ncbi:helix-turn-helix domain-containing protein [Fodinicola feengrottensis]|uniref:Helix-turn-helix domain-containing protein n=1 Tax=Fodinicola feengrottensis TaxID=435914 RepID=A0ABP4UYC2_9ACTN